MPDAEKSLDLLIRTKADLQQVKSYKDEVRRANREIADSYTVVSKEQAQQILNAKESAAATEKEFASKKELKHAIHGLSEEFPLLAHVARMAMNPITIVTASVGAAFWIFRERVEQATKAMAGMQLPDFKGLDPARISHATEAWQKFSEALRGAEEAYNSVGAMVDRVSKAIAAQAEEMHKNLEANKAMALADLEARKAAGKVTDTQYDAEKRTIESRYGHREMAEDWQEKQRQLDLKKDKANLLDQSAKSKNIAAGKIHVMSESDEGSINEFHEGAATEARARIKEGKDWLSKIAEIKGGKGFDINDLSTAKDFIFRYGLGTTGTQAEKMEQEAIANSNQTIAGRDKWVRGKFGRDVQRKTKDQLEAQARDEAAKAETIRLELPGEQAALDAATKGNIGRWNKAGLSGLVSQGLFTNPSMATGILDQGFAAEDARAHGKKLTNEQESQSETLKTLLTAIGWNMTEVISFMSTSVNKHKAHDAEVKALQAELAKVSAQLKGNNAVPR